MNTHKIAALNFFASLASAVVTGLVVLYLMLQTPPETAGFRALWIGFSVNAALWSAGWAFAIQFYITVTAVWWLRQRKDVVVPVQQ